MPAKAELSIKRYLAVPCEPKSPGRHRTADGAGMRQIPSTWFRTLPSRKPYRTQAKLPPSCDKMSRCFVSIHRQWGNSASPHANSVSVIGSGWPVSRCELQGRPLLEHVSGTAMRMGRCGSQPGKSHKRNARTTSPRTSTALWATVGRQRLTKRAPSWACFLEQLGTVHAMRSSTATPNEFSSHPRLQRPLWASR
jgi:hypothetical protein